MVEVNGGTANFDFFIVECDDHVKRYGFVGKVNSQSVPMATNLFLYVHLMYYNHQSFTQYTSFN